MNKYIYILILIFLTLSTIPIYSQSAVYFCETTGRFGYSYGNNIEEVKKAAYNSCLKNGGVNPELVVFTEEKGYGAIALGTDANGIRLIGAAVGFSSSTSAMNAAIEACKKHGGRNIKVEAKWYDK